MKSFRVKRAAVLLTAIALLLAAAVGGTIAYLVASTGEVVNTFTPTKVGITTEEEFPGNTLKKNVEFWNTGTIPAYIRVKVVVSWKASYGGQVYGDYPVAGEDYTITYGNGPWLYVENEDAWYYTKPVEPAKRTTEENTKEYFIKECLPIAGRAPQGYYLDVDILAQGIQAMPASVVAQAWGVTVASDGTISK